MLLLFRQVLCLLLSRVTHVRWYLGQIFAGPSLPLITSPDTLPEGVDWVPTPPHPSLSEESGEEEGEGGVSSQLSSRSTQRGGEILVDLNTYLSRHLLSWLEVISNRPQEPSCTNTIASVSLSVSKTGSIAPVSESEAAETATTDGAGAVRPEESGAQEAGTISKLAVAARRDPGMTGPSEWLHAVDEALAEDIKVRSNHSLFGS